MRTSAFRTVRRAGLIAGLLALVVAAVASATAGTSVGTHNTKRGKVLASVHGFSLYMFQKDKKGNGKSTCYGQCAKVWPPLLTTGKPVAMQGLRAQHEDARHDQAHRRQDSGHVQRVPALPVGG